MKTRPISFRCPEPLLKEIEILSRHNMLDRSGFIILALQTMVAGLSRQGIGEPQPPLPPAPDQKKGK